MKKLFVMAVVFSMATMSLFSVGLTMQVGAASAGDLITADYTDAVYYLGADGKRYVFTNEKCYKTWYEDFSGVVTVSQSELESYAIGGNVTYRPGTKMIKITTDPKVYAVEPGGVLRWVTTEAIAAELYGANWNTKIDDVSDAFWVNYTMGSDITSAVYPAGSLVQEEGSTTVYYINADGDKRPLANEAAMDANRFRDEFIQTSSDLSGYASGTSITGEETEISTTAGPGSADGDETSTGTLTVSVSSGTPASATVVKSATFVKFTKVDFTASGGDVIIDSVTIKRMGLSNDSNFSNVYLLDEDEEMHGNEKTLGSVHTAVVNDDITVSSGTTKSYWLAATMASSLQAGEVASLALSAVSVKGNAVVSGTLPLEGNGMTMNNTITIGTVTQTAGSTNPTTGSTSKQVGTTDYVFAATNLAVNSTEDVQIERIRFYQAGTAADSDVANLDLVVDGAVLSTVANPSNKAVIFDLSSSPYTISKGQNRTFEIRGDIVDGSSRTIEFEFDKKTDIKAKGKTYDFYITPSYTTSSTSSPYWNNTSYTTVSTGTLTVSKKLLNYTYLAEGSTQSTLGTFSFRGNGEPIIITQMVMEVTTTTTGAGGLITNITVYDEDGDVVAGPADPTANLSTNTVTLSDTFTVPTGEHVYTVKGDLDSSFTSGDTIRMDFNTPNDQITAKGEVTNNTVSPSPSSEVTGDLMTIRVGALSVSTLNTPVAQTVVAGTSQLEFANFVLDASASGEDVRVTQLKARHSTTAANLHQDITNITIYDASGNVLNSSDIEAGETSTTSKATTTIDLDEALIITKGSRVTLTLKGDISGSAGADEGHEFSMVGSDTLVAYGVNTGNSITETITNSDGQTMTVAANAALTVAVSSASPISDGLLPGNTDGLTIGVWNFRAQYANVNLEEIYMTISTSTTQNVGGPDQFDKIYLYDGATKVAEAVATTTDSNVETEGATDTGSKNTIHFDMSANPILITAGAKKDITVKVDTSNPDYYNYGGSTKGESGETFKLTINAVGDIVARANGLLEAGSKTISSAALKNYYLYKSVPTVLTNDLMSGGISSGTLLAGSSSNKDLYKFSVTADSAGDVGLYKVSFLVTTSVATATSWYLYQGGSQVANTSTTQIVTDTNAGNVELVEFLFTSDGTAPDAGQADVLPQTISAGETKVYTFKVGTLTGPSGTTSGSIQIQFLGDGTFPSTFPTGANTLRDQKYESNFVWGDYYRTYDSASTTASSTEQWTNGYLVPTGATTKLQPTSTSVTFSK